MFPVVMCRYLEYPHKSLSLFVSRSVRSMVVHCTTVSSSTLISARLSRCGCGGTGDRLGAPSPPLIPASCQKTQMGAPFDLRVDSEPKIVVGDKSIALTTANYG